MRVAVPIVWVAAALWLVAAACTQPRPPRPDQIAFGYTNAAGTRILMLSGEGAGDPKNIDTAICSEARRYPIRYLRSQERGSEDNGRQNAANFDSDAGPLFEVWGTAATPDDTCLLVSGSFLARQPIANQEAAPEEPSQIAARLRERKGRDIKSYFPLYASDAGRFAAVEFAPDGDRLLAALVYAEGDRLYLLELPADRDEQSCWRVDDGCVFDAGGMAVHAMFGPPGKPGEAGARSIFFTWDAAEGQNAVLYRTQDGALIEVQRAYRYRSPL